MYIDSLTITALVIFAFFVVLFIKYCFLNICGMSSESRKNCKERQGQKERS